MADFNVGQHCGRSHHFVPYKTLRHLAGIIPTPLNSPVKKAQRSREFLHFLMSALSGRPASHFEPWRKLLPPCAGFFPKQLPELPLLARSPVWPSGGFEIPERQVPSAARSTRPELDVWRRLVPPDGAMALHPPLLDVHLLGDCQCVIHLDSKIAHGAFHLCVSQQ
jgi:hypothetical protein